MPRKKKKEMTGCPCNEKDPHEEAYAALYILNHCKIYDPHRKKYYHLKKLKGPFGKGNYWVFNLPEVRGK